MILAEAVKLVKFHQNMLSEINEYTKEYMADLQDPNSSGSGIKLSEALEVILKGANEDGKGKDYPRAS